MHRSMALSPRKTEQRHDAEDFDKSLKAQNMSMERCAKKRKRIWRSLRSRINTAERSTSAIGKLKSTTTPTGSSLRTSAVLPSR